MRVLSVSLSVATPSIRWRILKVVSTYVIFILVYKSRDPLDPLEDTERVHFREVGGRGVVATPSIRWRILKEVVVSGGPWSRIVSRPPRSVGGY